MIRYADDFVILTESEETARECKETIAYELRKKGLELSEEKTKITHLKDRWVFGYTAKDSDGKATVHYLEKLAWTAITRHTLVTHNNSPHDPSLREYWEKRQRKNEEVRAIQQLAKGKCKVAKSTDYKCRWCGEHISSEGYLNVQLHHIIPFREGGKDRYDNLILLHSECHRQVTTKGETKPETLKRLGVTINSKGKVNKNPKRSHVKC